MFLRGKTDEGEDWRTQKDGEDQKIKSKIVDMMRNHRITEGLLLQLTIRLNKKQSGRLPNYIHPKAKISLFLKYSKQLQVEIHFDKQPACLPDNVSSLFFICETNLFHQ